MNDARKEYDAYIASEEYQKQCALLARLRCVRDGQDIKVYDGEKLIQAIHEATGIYDADGGSLKR